MRSDVHKVIVERPKANRTWESKTPRKKAVTLDPLGDQFNESANHIRLKRQKMRNSSLNILKRFLVSRVGSPWDKVYAEVCTVADPRSFAGAEVRDCLKTLVMTECWIEGQSVMSHSCLGAPQEVSGLFVHPKSRLLLHKAKASKKGKQTEP